MDVRALRKKQQHNYTMHKSSNVGARPRVTEREATTHYNLHLKWTIYLMDGKMGRLHVHMDSTGTHHMDFAFRSFQVGPSFTPICPS